MSGPAGACAINEAKPPGLDEVLRREPGVAVFSARAVERTPLDAESDYVWFEVIEVGRGEVPPRVYDVDIVSAQEWDCGPITPMYEVGESYVFVSSVGTGQQGPGRISGDRSYLADEAVDRGLVRSPSFQWDMFRLMAAMAAGAVLVLTVGHRRPGRTS
ncbi:MAG: hypothetical protein KDB33_20545 [Acidimicrobiales bacterium]|nr:hypothetical protein [Acidimicrobiales bacterium]